MRYKVHCKNIEEINSTVERIFGGKMQNQISCLIESISNGFLLQIIDEN